MIEPIFTKKSESDLGNFVELINHLVTVFEKNGIRVSGYNQNALNRFKSLSGEQKKNIIKQLQDYVTSCELANQRGIHLKETKRLLKYHLGLLGLVAPKSLLDSLDDGDVVEAYNLDQVQIFRSVVFLELCHYTLADVLTHEWYHLYERDDVINKMIVENINKVLHENNDLVWSGIPEHSMVEKFSDPRGVFRCWLKYFSPIFSGPNQRAGFVCTIGAKKLNEIFKPEEKLKTKLHIIDHQFS